MSQKQILDLNGQQFGSLTVIAFAGIRKRGTTSQHTLWTCRCKCGSVYDYSTGNLRGGYSTQCRQCGHEARCRASTKHGMSTTPIYQLWKQERCLYILCEAWQAFETFYAAVGNQPKGSWLCRPDTSKPFGPGNAVWLTTEERKTRALESKIDQYVALTGDDRDLVSDRFRRITRERRRQLILTAKGICRRCHGQLVWFGEGKACLCREFRGPRRRHWLRRLLFRLRTDESMSEKEAKQALRGVAVRRKKAKAATRDVGVSWKMPVPVDFLERCLVGDGVTELAAHYGVSTSSIYDWIKGLKLKRRIIYVAQDESVETAENEK